MKPFVLNCLHTICLLLVFIGTGYAQKEFFRSNQVFTEDERSKLYSSVTLTDSLVIFNAIDYKLYAYDKYNGSLKWSYPTNFKTNQPAFVDGNTIYAGIYSNQEESTATFDARTGEKIKILPFGPLSSTPLIKNRKLYGTAIYDFGCIIAYDIEKDTVTWSRFIAHGYEAQPYYFKDKIVANAEGRNWVELTYDGSWIDTSCGERSETFVEYIPCLKKFNGLTHDRLEITEKFAEKTWEDEHARPDILSTDKLTFAVYDGKLIIIGDKLKIRQSQQISSFSGELAVDLRSKLLKADDENLWLLYGDYLLQYNYQLKKLVKLTNLTKWEPRSVVLDKENAWLISRKDGLLYGLSL
ncbi:MAG TPA: PQQ-binding-like beta-propeller repeat protein [Ferruginibacter sp.]|nr:PQQ-binding-like beta-propeller repeat protein [Ferruginibacter sp.]